MMVSLLCTPDGVVRGEPPAGYELRMATRYATERDVLIYAPNSMSSAAVQDCVLQVLCDLITNKE